MSSWSIKKLKSSPFSRAPYRVLTIGMVSPSPHHMNSEPPKGSYRVLKSLNFIIHYICNYACRKSRLKNLRHGQMAYLVGKDVQTSAMRLSYGKPWRGEVRKIGSKRKGEVLI